MALKIFLSTKRFFFFTKYMANDSFSEPPRRADSKNPIFFFSRFWVWVTSKAWGSDLVGFWGSCQLSPFWGEGGSRPEGSIDPPPRNEDPASQVLGKANTPSPCQRGPVVGHWCRCHPSADLQAKEWQTRCQHAAQTLQQAVDRTSTLNKMLVHMWCAAFCVGLVGSPMEGCKVPDD